MDLASEAVDDKGTSLRGLLRFHGTRHVELDELPKFYKKWKNVSCEYNREWLKLNFVSCVVHQTRSYNKYGMVFVN